MRKLVILFFSLFVSLLFSQQKTSIVQGKVSYLSSQNIYAKFETTNGISVGDTLFIKGDKGFIPAIFVKYLSSKSSSGTKLLEFAFEVGTPIFALVERKEKVEKNTIKVAEQIIHKSKEKKLRKRREGDISGRFSLSAYGNISTLSNSDYVRWRYTFSARSENFRASNFSFDTYISFNYRSTEWSYIKNNISDALKIYSLAVNYKFNDNLNLTFGRKINRNISNVGAIDGVQLEGKFKNLTAWLVLGTHPDYFNYTLNSKLLEFGGFVSNSLLFNYGSMHNTIALFQQTNNSKVDRRFFYLQHSSSFFKQVHLFLSTEVDLYKRTNNIGQNDFSLTGLFATLRYKPSRMIWFQASYDARKNVIYYETFKNYADRLFTNATRQGLRLRVNIRPFNMVFINLSYGYRFRNIDIRNSENYSGSITYSSLPFVLGSFSLSYNHLTTSYLDGNIYGVRYSRDIFSGILFSNFNARYIDYLFLNGASNLQQLILGFDLSLRVMNRLSISLNYEGTFEIDNNYGRIYFNVTKRF